MRTRELTRLAFIIFSAFCGVGSACAPTQDEWNFGPRSFSLVEQEITKRYGDQEAVKLRNLRRGLRQRYTVCGEVSVVNNDGSFGEFVEFKASVDLAEDRAIVLYSGDYVCGPVLCDCGWMGMWVRMTCE